MAGWDDAIMLDARGQVISSSRGNIFIITAGKVLTPDLARCGIAGTRRQLLIDFILPSLGSEAEVCSLSWDQLMTADAVVITNAVMGIAEVVAIGDTGLPADGVDGLVSRMRGVDDPIPMPRLVMTRRLLFSVILLALAATGVSVMALQSIWRQAVRCPRVPPSSRSRQVKASGWC